MALDKNRLKGTLRQAFLDAETEGAAQGYDEDEMLDLYCDKLAGAIIDEVKHLHIVYTSGLTAGSNAVVGTINHDVE